MKLVFESTAYDILSVKDKYIACYERGLAIIDKETKELQVLKKSRVGHCEDWILSNDKQTIVVLSVVDNSISFIDVKTLETKACLRGKLKRSFCRFWIKKIGYDIFCIYRQPDLRGGTIITQINQEDYSEKIVFENSEIGAHCIAKYPNESSWRLVTYDTKEEVFLLFKVDGMGHKELQLKTKNCIEKMDILYNNKLYYSLHIPIRRTVTTYLYELGDETPIIEGSHIYECVFSDNKELVLYLLKKKIIVYSLKYRQVVDSLDVDFNSYNTIKLNFLDNDKYIEVRNFKGMYVYELERS